MEDKTKNLMNDFNAFLEIDNLYFKIIRRPQESLINNAGGFGTGYSSLSNLKRLPIDHVVHSGDGP